MDWLFGKKKEEKKDEYEDIQIKLPKKDQLPELPKVQKLQIENIELPKKPSFKNKITQNEEID